MNQEDWTHDWERFVEAVVASHNAGADDKTLSQKFGDHQVVWRGTVVRLELDVEYAPCVVLSMGEATSKLANGYEFFSDHLAVSVESSGRQTWRFIKPGSDVVFRCDLVTSNGPFDGITVSTFDEEREAFLEVGTANGMCLEV